MIFSGLVNVPVDVLSLLCHSPLADPLFCWGFLALVVREG